MKRNFFKTLLVLAFFSFIGFSCEQIEIVPEEVPDAEPAKASMEGETSTIAVFDLINTVATGETDVGENFEKKSLNVDSVKPYTVIVDTIVKQLTIIFPEAGAKFKGKTMKGTIFASFSKLCYPGNTTVVVSFNNFFIDNKKMSGKITLSCIFENHVPMFIINAVGMGMKHSDTSDVSWNSKDTILWETGYLTPDNYSDDVFKIWGASTGTGIKKKPYTVTIKKANNLLKSADCEYLKSGIIEILEGTSKTTIDFGNGTATPTCDSEYTVTMDGKKIRLKL